MSPKKPSGLSQDGIHLRIVLNQNLCSSKAFILDTASRPDKMSDLSRNAECVLRILKAAKDPLTTAEILATARQDEYADICQDCAGGDTFVVAARQLVDKGLITKKLGKGGYRWQMAGGN